MMIGQVLTTMKRWRTGHTMDRSLISGMPIEMSSMKNVSSPSTMMMKAQNRRKLTPSRFSRSNT